MTQQCKNNHAFERGIALMLFTLSLPVLLGLTVLGVDLGNLYITRDKLNALNRSASATAINARALYGWAALACSTKDGTATNLGYKCNSAVNLDAPPPRGEKYTDLMKEINQTLTSQISALFTDSKTSAGGSTTLNDLVQFGVPGTGGATSWGIWDEITKATYAPVYNLRDDKFQLKVRYGVKTILLSKLTKLLGMQLSGACKQLSSTDPDKSERCWVESSDLVSNSSTAPARVVLLLDTSGSMQSKQQALKSAAATFIDYFNPSRDRIGVISYGTGVKSVTAPAFFTTTGANDFLKIKNDITALTMGGQTNPCDALIEAAADAITPPVQAYTATPRTFVVLFTDGAPNVYRLGFCDPGQSACSQPNKLQQTTSPAPANDWYGWTVKWGRRKTFSPTSNNPVFDAPQIKDNNGATTFETSPSGPDPGRFRINENGDFMIRGTLAANAPWYKMDSTQSPAPIAGMPFSKSFETLTLAQDNYLWNGPSYLVNRQSQTAMGSVSELIDRVDSTVFTTCGPPTRPGSTPSVNQFQYNHSLYYASRVLDSNWSLTRTLFGTAQANQQQYLVRLRGITGPRAAPLDFVYPPSTTLSVPFYASDANPNSSQSFSASTLSPGCLTSLNAEIPVQVTGANASKPRLFVGAGQASFWSNTTADSIERVGEIIKTAELPYYCAIRTADYLRTNKNVALFAVGLGEGARYTYGENCEDPMQNALDFDRRKDFFLQRLALAPEGIQFASNQTSLVGATWQTRVDFGLSLRTLSSCTSHPLGPQTSGSVTTTAQTVYLGFSQGCVNNSTQPSIALTPTGQCTNPLGLHAKASDFSEDALGGYYPTNDPKTLSAQFAAIAKQILFRLSI